MEDWRDGESSLSLREAGDGRVLGAIMKEYEERMEAEDSWQHCENEKEFFYWLWREDYCIGNDRYCLSRN